jgi:3-deoxy-D-manno-octulosonic-acid transferase
MYFLYSFALSCLFLLLLPYFIFQALKHGKYFRSFAERLGNLPVAVQDSSRPILWVHTVSVGEFNAARPLLAKLKDRFPQCRLIVSTTTMTGQALARKEFPDKLDAVFYFPFDWNFAVRRALGRVNPAAVIILETELWPNFLRQCRRRGIKTIIVNGRISPRSFARYRRVRNFISQVLNDVSLLIMQSAGDAERALSLGADESRVRVCGNLKYDLAIRSRESGVGSREFLSHPHKQNLPSSGLVSPPQDLDEQFHLSAAKPLIVAGSTAAGEEAILLNALRDIRRHQGLEETRLLIAPRHPERFDEVARLIASANFTLARRSEKPHGALQSGLLPQGSAGNPVPQIADVILLDSIGELIMAYEFATVVFVGGSLVAKGGHNIIEPAAFAKPIIVGAHTENFRQIIADFAEANALLQVKAQDEAVAEVFTGELLRLLTDGEMARAMGQRAAAILLENRGATDRALADMESVLSKAIVKP